MSDDAQKMRKIVHEELRDLSEKYLLPEIRRLIEKELKESVRTDMSDLLIKELQPLKENSEYQKEHYPDKEFLDRKLAPLTDHGDTPPQTIPSNHSPSL